MQTITTIAAPTTRVLERSTSVSSTSSSSTTTSSSSSCALSPDLTSEEDLDFLLEPDCFNDGHHFITKPKQVTFALDLVPEFLREPRPEVEMKNSSFSTKQKQNSSKPVRSILKSSCSIGALLKFKERCQLEKQLQRVVVKGAWMTKFEADGSRSRQWFSVSPDGSDLAWNGFGKILAKLLLTKSEQISLADVDGLVPGPMTVHFQLNDWSVYNPANCFTIVLRNSLVCVECPDRETFMCWFLGLQSLCPMNSAHYISRAKLNWIRMYWLQLYHHNKPTL
jgi:hypothetical protein